MGLKIDTKFITKLAKEIKKKDFRDAGLQRTVYKLYQNAQRQRWMTENKSEGPPWKRLDTGYKKRKAVLFATFPGSGRKMLIATSMLSKSVIGTDNTYHRKLVDGKKLKIWTSLYYAPHVADVRPFMIFGDKTKKKIYEAIGKYYTGGKS